MNLNSILILGASSEISKAVAMKFAENNFDIMLAGRNVMTLMDEKEKISRNFNIKVTLHELDITQFNKYEDFISSLPFLPTVVLCSIGNLLNQKDCEIDINKIKSTFETNFIGPSILLNSIANLFEERKSGTIIGISSVAGDRGRSSNYFYGSSKAGFTTFLSGLRNRLSKKNVHVITVIPGYVKTKMIKNIKTPNFLTAKPIDVGNLIYNSYKTQKNVIYILPIWKFIMLVVRCIPEFIFKKMSF